MRVCQHFGTPSFSFNHKNVLTSPLGHPKHFRIKRVALLVSAPLQGTMSLLIPLIFLMVIVVIVLAISMTLSTLSAKTLEHLLNSAAYRRYNWLKLKKIGDFSQL